MVLFNELRVTPDGKHLIIDALVDPLSYYDNVYIDLIYLETLDTFNELGPSSLSIYVQYFDGNQKHIRLVLDTEEYGIMNNLIFVWILTKGTPAENTPCGMKDKMILGATYYELPLLQNSMKLLSGLNGCTPDKAFIDFILEREAFDLALKTGNYNKVIEYWKKLFKKKVPKLDNYCGCNGSIK